MVIKESSSSLPLEGFFWYINDNIVGIFSEVPRYNYSYELSGRTHENTWRLFKDQYLVDGNKVSYDYYPRGRVMVNPEYDVKGNFVGYESQVFADMCLDDQKIKDKIINKFNLYNIDDIDWFISEKFSIMNHYTCYNCREGV